MKKYFALFTALIITLLLFGVVSAQELSPLVCLDPGHGGNTGAQNVNYDLWEDEVNLDIAFRVKDLLEAKGYKVGMTRTDNSEKSNNDRYTYCNSIGANILVSIHTNSSTNTDIDGSMGLYFHKDDKILTQAIYETMYPILANDPAVSWPFTDFGLDRFASGVLLKSDMPAAMMEPVIMSYDKEAQLLVDKSEISRRQTISQALFDGIENYFTHYAGNGDGGNGGSGGRKCSSPPCNK